MGSVKPRKVSCGGGRQEQPGGLNRNKYIPGLNQGGVLEQASRLVLCLASLSATQVSME
jgi:hypothetical protein